MSIITKATLEAKYGVPVFAKWEHVPAKYKPRLYFAQFGIVIPKEAKFDAIKKGGPHSENRLYFLFKIKKWI